jgi:hypothetical protein
MRKTFYRVNHETTLQGLWYDFEGGFTGLIHDQFSFCQNRELVMDFDPEVTGFISATETLEELFAWFSREDILALQLHGFYIHQYTASEFKRYERFGHWLINQAEAKLVGPIRLEPADVLEVCR